MSMIVPGRKQMGKWEIPSSMPKVVASCDLHPLGCPSKAERRAAAKPPRAHSFPQELLVENLLCFKHWTMQ